MIFLSTQSGRFLGRACRICAFLICYSTAACTPSFGRVYFFPGDAFFHIEMDEVAMKSLSEWKEGPLLMWYEPPPSSAHAFGVSAGFLKCDLIGCDANLIARIEDRVLRLIGEKSKRNECVHCFVYDAKYNGRWNKPFKMEVFGPKSNEVRVPSLYTSFDDSSEMIVEDWFNSDQALKVPVTVPPDIDWERLSRPLEASVSIRVDEVAFLILTESQLKNVIRRFKGARFYEISKAGQWIVKWNGEKWIRDAIDDNDGAGKLNRKDR